MYLYIYVYVKKIQMRTLLSTKKSLFPSCPTYFQTLFNTFHSKCLKACCMLFIVTAVSPPNNFEIGAIHIAFLQTRKQKLREATQLVHGHTAARGEL